MKKKRYQPGRCFLFGIIKPFFQVNAFEFIFNGCRKEISNMMYKIIDLNQVISHFKFGPASLQLFIRMQFADIKTTPILQSNASLLENKINIFNVFKYEAADDQS